MSNDIYKILNNFNKLTEQKPEPTKSPEAKPKSKLQENIEQIDSKYTQYRQTLMEMDKSQPSSDRGGESSGNPYAKGGKATPVKAKNMARHAEKTLNKAVKKSRGVKEAQQDESALQAYLGKKKYGEEGMKALQQAGRDGASKEKMAKIRARHDKMDEDQGVAEGSYDKRYHQVYGDPGENPDFARLNRYKYDIDYSGGKTYYDVPSNKEDIARQLYMQQDRDGRWYMPSFIIGSPPDGEVSQLLATADSYFGRGEYVPPARRFSNMAEEQQDESALQAYLGKKKYGEKGMKALQQAGRDGVSKEKMAKIRAQHDRMDESVQLDEKAVSRAQQKFMGMVHSAKKGGKPASPEVAKVAKDISKKAARDFAATKHKGLPQHVNETIIRALQEGYSKEQIVQYLLKESDKEYWKDLIKDIPDKGEVTKTTHKGHYGTEYQGDDDEDDDGNKKKIAKPADEKRGRGRPKGVKNRVVRAGEKKAAASGEKRGRGRPAGSKNKMKEAWEIEHNQMIAEAYVKLIEKELGQTYRSDRMPNIPPPVPTDPTYIKDPKTGEWKPDVPKPAPTPKPAPAKGTEKRSDIEGDTAVAEMMRLAGMESKLHGKQHKLDVDKDGDIEADDLADLRAGMREDGYNEFTAPDYSNNSFTAPDYDTQAAQNRQQALAAPKYDPVATQKVASAAELSAARARDVAAQARQQSQEIQKKFPQAFKYPTKTPKGPIPMKERIVLGDPEDVNAQIQGKKELSNRLSQQAADPAFTPMPGNKLSPVDQYNAIQQDVNKAYMPGRGSQLGPQNNLRKDSDVGRYAAPGLGDQGQFFGGMKEDGMEEGNEFSGALDAARDAGKDEFTVGDKTYPVKESQLDECGEMGPMANGMGMEQEGKINVSTNMSSDGNKSVTVTADGEAAVELMQILALAGMKQQGQAEVYMETAFTPAADSTRDPNKEQQRINDKLKDVAGSAQKGAEQKRKELKGVKEEKDSRYEANTTPEEEVLPLEVQLKGGDGDVAGKEKEMNPNGSARFSDNPLAVKVKESMTAKLMREYEGIKVKK